MLTFSLRSVYRRNREISSLFSLSKQIHPQTMGRSLFCTEHIFHSILSTSTTVLNACTVYWAPILLCAEHLYYSVLSIYIIYRAPLSLCTFYTTIDCLHHHRLSTPPWTDCLHLRTGVSLYHWYIYYRVLTSIGLGPDLGSKPRSAVD